MRDMLRKAVPALSALLFTGLAAGCGAPLGQALPGDEDPIVIMVSLDGMHPDFLDRAPTPTFDGIARDGVRAEGLTPVYPSKTFPNHYSIATGLYAERHGLVDNSFWDPALQAMYRLSDRDAVQDGRFYAGEPIWVTAERQGLRAASYFWVGTEAPVQGVQPSDFRYFDGSVPNEARVDTVLYWLARPLGERPNLALLYFQEPDAVAHDHGPDAPEVGAMVAELDGVVKRLLDGVARLPFGDRVNIVLVSDHGMAWVPAENVIILAELVDLEGVRVVYNTTQVLLYFDGAEDRMHDVVATLRERLHSAQVYLRSETPAHWNYRDNPRIGDVVVTADLGWIIRWAGGRPWTGGGMHGWDPAYPEMNGIFMAVGPAFARGVTVPAFENIHVYPLLAHLLGLRPAEGIDGRFDAVRGVLANPNRRR
jgi:predicted AlkP superfamily pyrophosphatase or phosphodiesterase